MKNNTPILSIAAAVIALLVLGIYFLWQKDSEPTPAAREMPANTSIPTPSVEVTPSTKPSPTVEASPSLPTPAPLPSPTPPALNGSDTQILRDLQALQYGSELASMLIQEEVARKIVRAVYGLSEGRVVREYRPVVSPKGNFLVAPMAAPTEEDQPQLYRIARDNDQRYAAYISTLALINNEAFVKLYRFYLPTLESAYEELGVGSGNFHSTFIKAIDVLLSAPTVDEAIFLVQPSVMYKFSDPRLEKLPAAHKLMLRMGTENSEALKLELKKLKASLQR